MVEKNSKNENFYRKKKKTEKNEKNFTSNLNVSFRLFNEHKIEMVAEPFFNNICLCVR